MSEEHNLSEIKFKKGDKIVRFGRVYEIFKITEDENPVTEEEETIIHFKPLYETQANQSLICAIPVDNLDKTSIRQPMSKEEMEELLDFLKSKIEMKKRFNTRQAKEILKSNDAEKISLILKKLAIVRRDPDTNFTYTKKRVFRQGLKRLQEEVALVMGMDLSETRTMLLDILKEQAVISFPLDEEEDE